MWIELAKVLAIGLALAGGTFCITAFLFWALNEDESDEGTSQTKGQCL